MENNKVVTEHFSNPAAGEYNNSEYSFSADQMDQLKEELKKIKTQISEMMEAIKNITRLPHESASPVGIPKLETIQISPTYFHKNQISLLNAELKQIAENYKCPIIEVIPGPAEEHPVMKQLLKGVRFQPTGSGPDPHECYHITLGVGGFKRAVVQELLTEYPNLNLSNLVEAVLRNNNEWKDCYNVYFWYRPEFL